MCMERGGGREGGGIEFNLGSVIFRAGGTHPERNRVMDVTKGDDVST